MSDNHWNVLVRILSHLREGTTVALHETLILAKPRVVPVDRSSHVVNHFVHQLPIDVRVILVVRVVVGEANVVPPAPRK